MIKLRRIHSIRNLLCRNHAPISVQQTKRHTTVEARATTLIVIHMRIFVGNNLLARIRQKLNSRLICHRSRRKKHRLFHAKNRGNFLFQRNHSRVLPIHIIAHLCRKHRLKHPSRRFSNGITH